MTTLPPIGTYQFLIDAYLTDFNGKATLPMIGGFLLQSATKHAEERGFGYTYMTDQERVWVLSRMVIEIFEYPKNDSILVVKTWVSDVNRLFTERHFALETIDGREVGFAKSLWASIDINTRKATNVLELNGLATMSTGVGCPIKDMSKIPSLKDNCEKVSNFTVKYSDVDINKHINSMKYIEHFIDVFDIEMYNSGSISRFEINYLTEGKYGDGIDILQRVSDGSTYLLEMKNREQNTSICTSRIIWKNNSNI